MKELMIHVERIVRPVRAFAPRKLRMRRELLTHLQAAVQEERGRDADEASAIERAKARLGKPAEMTRALQQSVPWGERIMMARLPVPRAFERMEMRGTGWWALHWPMTMSQTAIFLVGATMLPFMVLIGQATVLKVDHAAALRLMFERPLSWILFNLATIVLSIATASLSVKFMIATASVLQSRTVVGYAAAILLLPVVWMQVMVGYLNGRMMTSPELLKSIGVGLFLLMSQTLIGRLVATMREPYAEWLTLNLTT